MNRLWVRFALVISGILLLVVFLPFLIGLRFQPSPELSREFTTLIETMSPELRAEFEMRLGNLIETFFGRTLIIAGIVGTVAGIILSRMLLSPLNDLSKGAEAITNRDLAYRVPEKGSTEMRTVAGSFNRMAADLEQAEALRRQLLADVAHELRNPLHVLRGNLQAILDGVYPMNLEEMSGLLDQTDHLTRLVNDLHELALAEARRLPLHLAPTDLGALVKDTAEVFRPLAAADGIDLRVELLGPSPTVSLDAARIRQALQNLLWNAMRHTPAGGAIRVTVTAREAEAAVAVSDNGEGIAPEHLPQVFDRFFRADPARDREEGGAGLGLAIVKAIVESHGGTVRAESPGVGLGSTFTMTLPTG